MWCYMYLKFYFNELLKPFPILTCIFHSEANERQWFLRNSLWVLKVYLCHTLDWCSPRTFSQTPLHFHVSCFSVEPWPRQLKGERIYFGSWFQMGSIWIHTGTVGFWEPHNPPGTGGAQENFRESWYHFSVTVGYSGLKWNLKCTDAPI
jgi:hypothetical protein